MNTTYTSIQRLFYPRHGIAVVDGVGRRVFWYPNRRSRDAEMARLAAAAAKQASCQR